MRFGILGPLRVTDSGREAAITAGRDRVVLAMLLLRPGEIVRSDDLVDAVWDERPPATARGQLQTCVSRLRRVLPPGSILTDPAGYGIEVAAADLDAAEFTRLVARAATLAEPDGARKLLREAVELWRGPALAGIESRVVRRQAAVLDERYATAIEDRIELDLAGGRDRDLVAELTGLVERFPLRERMRVQLMLALHRAGRQAEALAEYRRARELLRDELGIEPGGDLQELHRRILVGDVPAPRSPSAPAAPVDNLPRAVADFTGRGDLVDRLVRAIDVAGQDGPLVRVIDGMAGSGKTTLAVHLAGLVRDRFPDARLFIDLHGHSERRPLEPAAALVTLLRQLGVPAERIPDDLDDRVRLWRGELAARRALVVLDNAASTAQVTPLLPGSGQALVLVTSRRRLAGLDAVRPESLSVLPEADAVALLARIAGDRVAADPDAAREVVRRCGCLPLAIRLAGARLAHRPRWRVADLVRRLGESALPALAAEDRTVASAFALSYEHLPAPVQRMFRLLGLHPAERFEVLSVAALTGSTPDDAQDVLDDLVDAHLVEEPEPNSYRLHDLVRQYAAAVAAHEPADDRVAALIGLVDFHLHTTVRFHYDRELDIARKDYPRGDPQRPDLVELAAADPTWLERQRPDIPGLMAAAVRSGDPKRAWQLARVNWMFLYERSYTDDLINVLTLARTIAEESGDAPGVVVAEGYLASGFYRAGRHDAALRLLRAVLAHDQRVGNRAGEARGRANLGGVLWRLGRLEEALVEVDQSYRLAVALRDTNGIGSRTINRALMRLTLGRYDEALLLARRGLQAAIENADDRRTANALLGVGQARRLLGQLAPAGRIVRASMGLAHRIGYRVGVSECRNELGRIALAEGRHAESTAHHLAALELMREHNDLPAVSYAANDLAAALSAMGDRDGAVELRRHALALARSMTIPHEQGRALAGLADCIGDEDPQAARLYRQQALDIFTRMGVPERFDVERRLLLAD